MKAKRSNRNISPYGGVVPILYKIREFGIPQLIRKCLKKKEKKKQAKYGYDDIFISWVLIALCGGTRLDHITKLKKKLKIIPGLKLPSHDTLGRDMKRLATETLKSRNVSSSHNKEVFTDYNDNIPLNRMLIQSTKRAGALKENIRYTMDIDATFIPTECRGAVRKKNEKGKIEHSRIGFNPMVCLIGDLPVYISMRNGDAGARFMLPECLRNTLSLLEESKIKIGRVISDAAGYSKEAFEMLEEKGIKFLVRFPYMKNMVTFKDTLRGCCNWRHTEINTANFNWKCEIGDIPYKMHDIPATGHISPTWRVVAIRIPLDKTVQENDIEEYARRQQVKEKMKELDKRKVLKEHGKPYSDGNWKEIDGYLYKFFITNDFKKKSEDLVIEYNNRGNAERKFSFMKNDFGWRYPPFSQKMEENTVFMIAAAMANNIFRGMVVTFKKQIPQLRLNARLREFQFEFINVACSYLYKQYVFYETDVGYEKLFN